MVSCQIIGQDRMGPHEVSKKDPFKKEKKATEKLKFRLIKPIESEKDDKVLEFLDEGKTGGWFNNFIDKISGRRADYIDNINYEQLMERKHYHELHQDKEVLEKYLDKLIAKCNNQTDLKNLRFELAVNYIDRGFYKKASKAFTDFIDLYPNDKNTEFASYMELLSLDLQRNDATRDQTETKELITKGKKFLKKTTYKLYMPYVETMVLDAYKDLFQAEINKFDFYAKSNKIKSAEKVLELMKKDLVPYVVGASKEVEQLEKDIQALKDGKGYIARSVRLQVEKFPKLKKSQVFRDRF